MAIIFDDRYETEVRDLLILQYSDDTLKTRRNLVFMSFIIIISISYIKLPLQNLDFLGINLIEDSGIKLTILAIIITLYWLTLFIFKILRDINIHIERRRRITKRDDVYNTRHKKWKDESEKSVEMTTPEESEQAKSNLEKLERNGQVAINLKNRLSTALKIQLAIDNLQNFLPIFTGSISLGLLCSDLYILTA
jgi:hypothetical protein